MKSVYVTSDVLPKKNIFITTKDLILGKERYFIDEHTEFIFDIKQYNKVEKNYLNQIIDFEIAKFKENHNNMYINSEILDTDNNVVLYITANHLEIDKKIEELVKKRIYVDKYLPDAYLVAKYISLLFKEKKCIVLYENSNYRYLVVNNLGVPYHIEKEKQKHNFGIEKNTRTKKNKKIVPINNEINQDSIEIELKISELKDKELLNSIINSEEFEIVYLNNIISTDEFSDDISYVFNQWVIQKDDYYTS